MKKPKPKAKTLAPMTGLVLEPGEVIHYQGLPFLVTDEITVLGSRENVEMALEPDE